MATKDQTGKQSVVNRRVLAQQMSVGLGVSTQHVLDFFDAFESHTFDLVKKGSEVHLSGFLLIGTKVALGRTMNVPGGPTVTKPDRCMPKIRAGTRFKSFIMKELKSC